MSQLKLILFVAGLSLLFVDAASAQPGWRHPHRFYYGYGPPVYAYPPVVVAPPPVVVGPTYPAPVYPPPAYVAPGPVYGPPVYGYGVFGPRHFGFGYAAPGVGVFIGR